MAGASYATSLEGSTRPASRDPRVYRGEGCRGAVLAAWLIQGLGTTSVSGVAPECCVGAHDISGLEDDVDVGTQRAIACKDRDLDRSWFAD